MSCHVVSSDKRDVLSPYPHQALRHVFTNSAKYIFLVERRVTVPYNDPIGWLEEAAIVRKVCSIASLENLCGRQSSACRCQNETFLFDCDKASIINEREVHTDTNTHSCK